MHGHNALSTLQGLMRNTVLHTMRTVSKLVDVWISQMSHILLAPNESNRKQISLEQGVAAAASSRASAAEQPSHLLAPGLHPVPLTTCRTAAHPHVDLVLWALRVATASLTCKPELKTAGRGRSHAPRTSARRQRSPLDAMTALKTKSTGADIGVRATSDSMCSLESRLRRILAGILRVRTCLQEA